MMIRASHVCLLCAIATTGLLAALVADEVHKTGTDTGWRWCTATAPSP